MWTCDCTFFYFGVQFIRVYELQEMDLIYGRKK